MAVSRLGLLSVLGLTIGLFTSRATAQDPTPSFGQAPTPTLGQARCLTFTSLTTPTTCSTPRICPACPIYITEATQPCNCPYPAPTVTKEGPCCQGCGSTYTHIVSPTGCVPTVTPCAVITETAAPGCPIPVGCMTPDCILLSTIVMGCSCRGVSTVTSCNGRCPGCATDYRTIYPPCAYPTTPTVS